MARVYLSLGSNQGDRLHALGEAYWEIVLAVGFVVDVSSVFETEPWGFESDEKFLNLVLEVETDLDPVTLIHTVLTLEQGMGRVRSEGAYQSRNIDIDILLFDDQIIREENLKVPHPKMPERRFVLIPLAEIAPDRVDPRSGNTIAELLNTCNDTTHVEIFLKREEVEQRFARWKDNSE